MSSSCQEWTSLPMPELLTMASHREEWKRISAESSFISPGHPSQSRRWPDLNCWSEGQISRTGCNLNTLSSVVAHRLHAAAFMREKSVFPLREDRPCRLTFTRCGCYGLSTELAHPFFFSLHVPIPNNHTPARQWCVEMTPDVIGSQVHGPGWRVHISPKHNRAGHTLHIEIGHKK